MSASQSSNGNLPEVASNSAIAALGTFHVSQHDTSASCCESKHLPPDASLQQQIGSKSVHVELPSPEMSSLKSNRPKHGAPEGNGLWVDGLLCAYEFIPGPKKGFKVGGTLDHRSGLLEGTFDAELTFKSPLTDSALVRQTSRLSDEAQQTSHPSFFVDEMEGRRMHPQHKSDSFRLEASHWVPIGWTRIAELVESVQIDAQWEASEYTAMTYECDISVADIAAPYWEPKSGPTWWCNVLAGHPHVEAWLANSQKWLHPAVSEALKDESKLISERMKHLFYEDKSVRITHNLTVFGGCGLVLSIITGLFGINVDGIPGSSGAPYTFCIFSVSLLIFGALLVGFGFLCLGLKRPITERQLAAKKLELQDLIRSFQQAAETHAKVHGVGSFSSPEDDHHCSSIDNDYEYLLIL
ncbi:hypothetical protein KP509_08G005900 [Ceratopteris richardii]|uniref:Uncharacterized protein n=1 Tax=Ceratopteris richardii TaxID=49495 RepID=A0A8T2UA07_CERRI|nr:hypothetical protein KP509_08G005900 [Ceratopteris richardii]